MSKELKALRKHIVTCQIDSVGDIIDLIDKYIEGGIQPAPKIVTVKGFVSSEDLTENLLDSFLKHYGN